MFWPGSYSIFFLLEEPFLYMKRCSKVSEDEEEDLLSFPPYIKRHKGIFEFINSNHSSLQYFSIPHGYREIADEAFSGCYSLKNIVIPESITSIGSGAFRGCFSLVNITIPHVISIEAEVFRSCISLSNIIIPNSVTKINWGPLKNVKHLPMSQFQIVLIKFALMLFPTVQHLNILIFQTV